MEYCTTVVLAVFVFISGSQAYDLGDCPENLNRDQYLHVYRDHCYEFVMYRDLEFENAEKECVGKGGMLAKIPDAATQNWMYHMIKDTYGQSYSVWIGLTDRNAEDTWEWVDGTIPEYTNWAPGQPGIVHGLEDCAAMDPDDGGRWHDYSCSDVFIFADAGHHYVCQYDVRKSVTVTFTTTTSTPVMTSFDGTTTSPSAQTPSSPSSSLPYSQSTSTPAPLSASFSPSSSSKTESSSSLPSSLLSSPSILSSTLLSTTIPISSSSSSSSAFSPSLKPTTKPLSTIFTSDLPFAPSSPSSPSTTTTTTTSPSSSTPKRTSNSPTSTMMTSTQPTSAKASSSTTPPPKTTGDAFSDTTTTGLPTTSVGLQCPPLNCNKNCGLSGYKMDQLGCLLCECEV